MSLKRKRNLMNQMNVVPYIDVMLVLLVIFMVTAPMFTPGVIDIPSVSKAASVQQEPIEVQILLAGQYRWVDQGVVHEESNLDALAQAVSKATQNNNRPVAISASGQTLYANVVEVADKLYLAGVQKVALTVQKKT